MSEVVDLMKEKVMQHAKKLEFEEAKKIKEQIDAIGHLGEKQIARDAIDGNYDAVVVLEKYNSFFGVIAKIRNGEISGVFNTRIETRLEESLDEIAEQFIARAFTSGTQSNSDTPSIPQEKNQPTVLLGKESYTERCRSVLEQMGYTVEIPEQ